jgi:secretion/DNA translocation related TadE-like protein
MILACRMKLAKDLKLLAGSRRWRTQGPDTSSSGPGQGAVAGPRRVCGPKPTSERGSGTVLAAGLGMLLMLAMVLMLLLAQSAVMASRAAAAADLAALAAADAVRGISAGEPCSVAAVVAGRHDARVLSCTEGAGETVEIRTELLTPTMVGPATGHARAGPPP